MDSTRSKCIFALAVLGSLGVGCREKEPPLASSDQCVQDLTSVSSGPQGRAFVFNPDPIVSSGNPTLSPSSLRLDSFREEVTLRNLGGRGVLEGAFVDVRNGLSCREGFLAFDPRNEFLYSHGDARFQEAMTYYFGDAYRSHLNEAGYLLPRTPLKIVAHCMHEDNAYYMRGRSASGAIHEKVCLGDSRSAPGASYADDAMVVLHEIQHATTVNAYSLTQDLNSFFYDEAGALNEAISDFMTLGFLEPAISPRFDPRFFSRWALGTFQQNYMGLRGAHPCPMYDSAFREGCSNFKSDFSAWSGFSGASNTISYVYPDGLGWPYADNFSPAGSVRAAFLRYRGQEEIHNTSVILASALWAAYERIKAARGGDGELAFRLMTKVVTEAVKHLPKPNPSRLSPVTFNEFADRMATWGPVVGLSSSDQQALEEALRERGLLDAPQLEAGWAAVGPGKSSTPGIRVLDHPDTLRSWIASWMGGDPQIVRQGIATGLNNKLDAGDVAAIWLDLKNESLLTAGAVLVDVTSTDPDLTFLGPVYNAGLISSQQAQVRYGKVNGKGIVSVLAPTVPTGNTYFLTNPNFDSLPMTALWVKVADGAQSKSVELKVRVSIANGPSEELSFWARIE